MLNPSAAYHPEGGAFSYQTQSLFSALDARPRLGSSNLPSGMAPRLAHQQARELGARDLTTREQYNNPGTPAYRRSSEHSIRSPSFPASVPRRLPLSPTPSPIAGFTAPVAIDATFPKPQATATIPPLEKMASLGTLEYADGGGTHVRPEIHGTIDKGFFLSDGEWTCYRRNYFSCVCSYSLTPHYPSMSLQFTPKGSEQTYHVAGFAMTISAVVAENDDHSIELVQHTPKRDKGPIAKPEKVRLAPKTPQLPGRQLGLYSSLGDPSMGSPAMYGQNYAAASCGSQGAVTFQTEHTFERIQFKQATANNGKRRAAQQYYHLVVELWADIGTQGDMGRRADVGHRGGDQFIRVAYRRSAKMIVRGRSPGHYQTERRGSTSSGPGGGSGSLSGYGNGPAIGPDFLSNNSMISSGFPRSYDASQASMPPFTGRHPQQEIPVESMIPPEEAKTIEVTKGYQYYPGTTYEAQQDHRGGVDTFTHQRPDHSSSAFEVKTKTEYDTGNSPLPSLFHPGPLAMNRRCGPFEGKPRSDGYYPSMVPPSGINIANIT